MTPELIIDNFAGGGGASLGIEMALGRRVNVAINHDPVALAMHEANHPDTRHLCESVWDVDPRKVCGGIPVGLAWFSPDCTHHSKAKGGKPVKKGIRALAWVAKKWAGTVRPRVICLENVEELVGWGPLVARRDRATGRVLAKDGWVAQPGESVPVQEQHLTACKRRKGRTFRHFVRDLRALGYVVEWRELRACDFGAPTVRKRLFLIARRDGLPIVWPEPTHGDPRSLEVQAGHLLPWRTAAECIDWGIPCPSIFERRKPLADATCRRIARGVMRYVVENPRPFIVPVTHQGERRAEGLDEPAATVTGAHRGERALVTPFVTKFQQHSTGDVPGAPLHSVMAGATRFGVVAPTLVQTGYGERPGQAPRCLDLHQPVGTLVDGQKHGLVAAWLAKHYGGPRNGSLSGTPLGDPMPTVTTTGQLGPVAGHLVKLRGECHGAPMDGPAPTITAGGWHLGAVAAFLTKYYGEGVGAHLVDPAPTATTRDRLGLVQVLVDGEAYLLADIGMRMLQPRELFRAQGFPDSYQIDLQVSGKQITKTAQVKAVGNSVCPPLAAALARANVPEMAAQRGQQALWGAA